MQYTLFVCSILYIIVLDNQAKTCYFKIFLRFHPTLSPIVETSPTYVYQDSQKMFVFVTKNSDFVRKKYPSLLAWNIFEAFGKTKNLYNDLKKQLFQALNKQEKFLNFFQNILVKLWRIVHNVLIVLIQLSR